MSKKLQHNGLWESSRMMLPEHKEAVNQRQRLTHRKQRPMADEQAIEQFSQLIATSMLHGETVTVVLFGEFQDRTVTGIIAEVNQRHEIKLIHDSDTEWIKFEDIVDMWN